MNAISKSKLLAYRQCHKRLWLEMRRPDLLRDSASTKTRFAVGHEVGDIARRLYDPKGKGVVIDARDGGVDAAIARTAELLETSQLIFEAGFSAGGARAFADVLKPTKKNGKHCWRMIEVKSSTSVKEYHRDDVAIQAFIARAAGLPLVSISLAHIDSSWLYPGKGDYKGLLIEEELTEEAFARKAEVKKWIAETQTIARKRCEPKISTGPHCRDPYECGFLEYCQGQEPQAEFPVSWLPRIQAKALKAHLKEHDVADLRKVPDKLLNELQLRVKKHTLSDTRYFDSAGADADVAKYKLPAYFLDFETIQFAVPIWKGTRPYQQIPFQFSAHRLSRTGKLTHDSFLDLSGKDPSKFFAETLIATCGERGPVFVYNASFERTRIKELAQRFKTLKSSLLSINERLVDLLDIARERYYHPRQQGSWSIKKVLPTIAPDLSYEALDGVQDGETAMSAFQEAIAAGTTKTRKEEIERQLKEYCGLDTLGLVRIWEFFFKR